MMLHGEIRYAVSFMCRSLSGLLISLELYSAAKFDCSAGLVFPDFDSENTPRIILCLNTIKHEAGSSRAPFLAFSLCGLGFFHVF